MPRAPAPPRLVWREDIAAWVIRWRERGAKRERSTSRADRGEAETAFTEWKASRLAGDLRQRGGAGLTVDQVLTIYLVDRENVVADSARLGYAADALMSWWKGQKVSEIRGQSCRAYAAFRAKSGIRPSTARRELSMLQSALNFAHREGILDAPVSVALPPKSNPKDRWLTRDEAAALLRAARGNPHLVTFIRIGLETGQRKTAILQLGWTPSGGGGHVDLKARRINFNPHGRVQTKKRRPIVPISWPLVSHLTHVRRRTNKRVIEFEDNPVGNIRRAFATACRTAKLTGVTPHTLRHTAITWACQRGLDPWTICGYFGVTMEVLQEVYLHHHPDYLKAVSDRRKA